MYYGSGAYSRDIVRSLTLSTNLNLSDELRCEENLSFFLVRRNSSSVGLSKSLRLNASTAGNILFDRSRAEKKRRESYTGCQMSRVRPL